MSNDAVAGSDRNSDGPGLFEAYTIDIEAQWDVSGAGVRGRDPAIADACEKQLALIRNEAEPSEARWRAAYRFEQLFGQVMPIDRLVEAGDRRLSEAKALALKSAADLESRWTEARQAPPPSDDRQRAVYASLIGELQWFYNRRALDRRMRSRIAGQIFVRTLLTFGFFVALFLAVALAVQWPWLSGQLNKVPADVRTTFLCCCFAVAFGALGAIFSRLISFQARFALIDFDEAATTYVGRMLNIRQAVGAIGALVIFFAILGDLIGGNLFPNMDKLSASSSWMNEHSAKLLVWSFLAGFSERLVPDFLARAEASAAAAGRPNA